jgi:adenylyl-sulfate kinase
MRATNGFTLWLTGLSGAGKTTLALGVRDALVARGYLVEVLDGDEVRRNLSLGLGFSKQDRDANVRRIGYVARLLSRHGVVVIAAAISPYRDTRDEVRREHEGAFVEVFVDCSLDLLVQRDRKGLYARALRGELQNMTGVSDPYEPPLEAEVTVHTDHEQVDESLAKILAFLEQRALIARR